MTSLPEGIAWIRLTFVDVSGATHAVQLPASRYADALDVGAPFDGSALEGRARLLEADMLLRPDPATLCAVGADVARVACTVLTPDGRPWPGDPRTALLAVVEQLEDLASGYTAAAELEFYLLDANTVPLDRGGYFEDAEGAGIAVVREAARRLEDLGIGVMSCHHEAGPGQYEIDLRALPPLALADALILAKQTVHEAARSGGVRATFMPRPFSDQPGSGLHLHQRVDDRLFDESGKLDDDGRAFCAGQLTHARALSALASPTVNSYKRLHAGPEAPGAAVWAHLNRAALLRVSPDLGSEAAIEYRAADPSANPYLLLCGLLAAAAHGLEADLELPPPVEETAGGFGAEDSVRYDPLPRTLEDAVDALVGDDVIADAFDTQLLTRLVDGRRADAETYRAHVTQWERDRYLDEA